MNGGRYDDVDGGGGETGWAAEILLDIQSDNSYLTPIAIIIAPSEMQGAQLQIRHYDTALLAPGVTKHKHS